MLTAMRRGLRRIVPEPTRAGVALVRRSTRDRLSGIGRNLARQRSGETPGGWLEVTAVTQDIKRSPLWEGKQANIELGCALLDGLVVEPGQVLSFFAAIGRPDAARGFAVGRSIRADEPGGDIGGGLCQLSGLVYELGLRAGLAVVERHPHSRDLYASEAERFTPLGLDATVVWPWKDLRMRNDHPVPVTLRLRVEAMELRGVIHAPAALPERSLRIERSDGANERRVTVWRDGLPVSSDRYAIHRAPAPPLSAA